MTNGNICPICGKSVMDYRRFLREAEPYKTSTCDNCKITLKRDPRVYAYLGFMCVVIAIIGIPLFIFMEKIHFPVVFMWSVLIAYFICWVFLTNYLSWRYIGWVEIKNKGS